MNTESTLRPFPNALLNPRCDAIFKKLFTDNSKEGRLALKSFLEASLNAEVSDIRIIQNELPIESENDRQTVFDIACTLNGTIPVNIEMQGINVGGFYGYRAEYQAAHLLNHFVQKGAKWEKIPKVFQISVLNFIYAENIKRGLLNYTMRTEDGHALSERLTVVLIELPKYIDNCKDSNRDVGNLTAIEKWCKFLLYADDSTKQSLVKDICESDGGIMAASEVLIKITQDDINWAIQTSRDMWERDQLSIKYDKELVERELKNARNKLTEITSELEEKDCELKEKDCELKEKDCELRETKAELAEKEAQILELQAKLMNTLNECAID